MVSPDYWCPPITGMASPDYDYGRKPTLSTYRMLCWHFSGWAEQDELLRHISKLQRQDAVEKTE